MASRASARDLPAAAGIVFAASTALFLAPRHAYAQHVGPSQFPPASVRLVGGAGLGFLMPPPVGFGLFTAHVGIEAEGWITPVIGIGGRTAAASMIGGSSWAIVNEPEIVFGLRRGRGMLSAGAGAGPALTFTADLACIGFTFPGTCGPHGAAQLTWAATTFVGGMRLSAARGERVGWAVGGYARLETIGGVVLNLTINAVLGRTF
jgi:hypothetical protein